METEVNLATFSDYRHGLTKRSGVPAAMTRKRSLAAVQESAKEVTTGARKVGATFGCVSLAGGQTLCQVSQAAAKRPGRPGRGLKPTTGSASRAGEPSNHSRHF